ncbi:MAG TPA: FAD-dependent monooxygenase [Rubrivivax sp.]|nr:FAD-dependent monooxygenase [Rubrivivax sp.]
MSSTEPIERIGPYVYRHFAPPPLPAHQHAAVAIVGGGPVGLATALGLARQGVRSVVIEADDSVCVGSRAACISRRSLEICGRLDALPEMLQRGLPWSGGRSFWQSTEVFSFSMPLYEGQRLPPMINLQQYYIEDALLAAVARANESAPGSIDIRWATTVDAIEAGAGGASLGLVNGSGRGTLQADWVVACDGGQSFVRNALGLALEGTAYTGRYVIVDIELPSKHPTERRAWFDPPWHRGATVLMHRQPDDLWRIDWQLRHGDRTEEAMQPENVRAFVQRHLDAIGEGHLEWKPAWSSIYRAGAMTLAGYRHGRVLFAGNAAHAMPIFGVRGLNSGLDDADNLAWKLAAVLHGGSDALLDSYSSERVQAFHVNAESARRSTEFMSPPSRGFDVMREAVLSLAEHERGIAELINPRQTAAVAYTGSPLSTPDTDAWTAGPAPGEVLPEVPVGGPVGHVTEVVGPGFVLLHFGAPPPWTAIDSLRVVPVLEHADAQWPLALIDARARLARAYGAAPGSAYLLRPDGHVAARWQRCSEAGLRAALRRAQGREAGVVDGGTAADSSSARDRIYTRLAQGVSTAGSSRETLFLARLALLLCERLDDEAVAGAAIDAALQDLPEPSLSAPDATY